MVDQAFYNKEELFVCFVDFKKAYDLVWRDGLFYKLIQIGFSSKFVKTIMSMYESLSTCVFLSDGLSQTFTSKVGLKQGCNLSPTFFNLFINDFIDNIKDIPNSPKLGDINVNSLFYADDLVLIAKSKEDLQLLINKLHAFSNKWFLEVNTSKTKAMVFSRKRKNKSKVDIVFGNQDLPQCESYCYLGTTFHQNGSFKLAIDILYNKAIKAMFSILRTINKYRSCDTSILIKLFNAMVIPIMLYNSEVWGNLSFHSNVLDQSIEANPSVPVSSIQLLFFRIILGVSKKTSKFGIFSELGELPLILRVVQNMIKYWGHLRSSKSPILKQALNTNMELNDKGFKTWFSSVKQQMQIFKIEHILYTTDSNEIDYQMNIIKKRIKDKYVNDWKKELDGKKDGKLGFYSQYIDSFSIKDYLTNKVLPTHLKRVITRFRIGAHKLPIETGRYNSNVSRNERECPLCSCGIGDEKHYLISCINPIILRLRNSFFTNIDNQNSNFLSLDEENRIRYLMKSNDYNTLSNFGFFLIKLENIFKESNPQI